MGGTEPGSKYSERPRLAYTQAEIDAVRAMPEAVKEAVEAADARMEKERTSGYEQYYVPLPDPPQPPRHDDGERWPYWTGLCGEIRGDMEALAYAFVLTADVRYFDRCRRMMLAVSGWDTWEDPDYGEQPCLDTFSLNTGVATAYDLLHGELSEEDRETIRGALIEKGIEFTFRYANDPKSYVYDPEAWPNGYAMTNVGMGMGALAVAGEVDDAGIWIEKTTEQVEKFLEREGGVDGGLVEGISYGSAAIDPFMTYIIALRNTTGTDLLEHPFLKKALLFPLYFIAPGGNSFVPITDAGGSSGAGAGYVRTAQAMVRLKEDGLASWYLQRVGKHSAETQHVPACPPENLPRSRLFSGIHWAALRTGWEADDVLFAFKSGYTRNHNHLDQNSFVVGTQGEWLATDQGYQRYDRPYPTEKDMDKIHKQHLYTFTSVGHNTLLIDGEGQEAKEGRINGFLHSPVLDYLQGDASDTYLNLFRFHRNVLFVRPDYFVIWDDVETDGQDREAAFLLHADPRGTFRADGAAVVTGVPKRCSSVTLEREGGLLQLDVIYPSEPEVTHIVPEKAEDYGSYVSVQSLKSTRPCFLTVLSVGKKGRGLPALAYELEGDVSTGSFTLEVDGEGWADVIVFGGGGEDAEEKGFVCDGTIGFARLGDQRGVKAFGLMQGRSLRAEGEKLIDLGDAPGSGAGMIESDRVLVTVDVGTDGSVAIGCPSAPTRVEVDSTEVQAEYDSATKMASVEICKGEHRVELRW